MRIDGGPEHERPARTELRTESHQYSGLAAVPEGIRARWKTEIADVDHAEDDLRDKTA